MSKAQHLDGGGDPPIRGDLMQEVARLAGIEPTTLGFGGRYSIH